LRAFAQRRRAAKVYFGFLCGLCVFARFDSSSGPFVRDNSAQSLSISSSLARCRGVNSVAPVRKQEMADEIRFHRFIVFAFPLNDRGD
jgi:hypothetical protein